MIPKRMNSLRRHAIWVHFASNSFGPIHFVLEHFRLFTLDFEHVGSAAMSNSMSDNFFIVSHHVGHLIHLHVGHLGSIE